MHRQRHLGELGAHPQQSRAPHPEYRARPADGDRARHAGDVAGADGRSQRGADRLKRRHCAVGGVLPAEDASDGGADGIGEFPDLQKAGPHAEQQAHADDADHRRDAPNEAVDRLIDGCDGFEHDSLRLSLEAVFVSGVQCLRKRLPDFNTTKDILSHSTRSVNLFLRSARSG